MKPISYQLILIFFIIFGFACSKNTNHPEQLVIGLDSFPQSFDPRVATDAASVKINQLIYRGLFKLNDDLKLIPDLVEDYQWVDPTHLKIILKPDLKFSDGSAFTAEDVVDTYRSILHKDFKSRYKGDFSLIKEMKIISDYQIDFYFSKSYASILTNFSIGILPSEVTPKNQFQPIGLGPYQIEEIVENQRIDLKANLYAEKKPKTSHIRFRTIFDNTLRLMELIKGRLDLVQNGIVPILLSALDDKIENKSLILQTKPGINFSYLGFNLRDPILSHIKVRKAIAYGLDVDKMIKYKLKGMGLRADSILSPNHWAYHDDLMQYSYQPELAERILDLVGYPLKSHPDGEYRFKLQLKTSTRKDKVDMALLMAKELEKIGIKLEVKSYEFGTLMRDIQNGNFQIYSLTWVGVTDPDIFYVVFHSENMPPNGQNRGFYENPAVDFFATKGRSVHDLKERIEYYLKLQNVINEDLPYIPLWYDQNLVVYQNNIKGYQLRPDAGFQNLVEVEKIID